MPGLGLESRSDIDGVVDDVQALDTTVRAHGGDVDDIERSGGARRQSPVEVDQKLIVVASSVSVPVMTDLSLRSAWLVSAKRAG